jgi:hypothetical protein
MRERETFLRSMEHRLSRLAGWLGARRHGGEKGDERDLHARAEALREEIARARRAFGWAVHEDLARVRDSLDDMRSDYGVPPPHYALRREELDALRRHLHTTARLVKDLANADAPGWNAANEEYERSWEEVERAFEGQGDAASP